MTGADDLVTGDVDVAARRLLDGGVVAIPTETVYGLAAIADDPDAVERVFALKDRPRDHPLIVHVASVDDVDGWAAPLTGAARILADACWPGPLTLLVRRGPRTIDAVTGGRDTVGIRVPAHRTATELLVRVGTGLAAPSANRFGHVSPTSAAHVLDDLGAVLVGGRDAILDGGSCPVGVESTIVDCTVDPPQVLRPGGIPTEDLVALLASGVASATGSSRAAGMLTSHYAPRCAVHLAASRDAADRLADRLTADGLGTDVLDRSDDLVAYARDLYAELRRADQRGLDALVAVMPAPQGLGHAVRDRLTKAAADVPRRPTSPSPDR